MKLRLFSGHVLTHILTPVVVTVLTVNIAQGAPSLIDLMVDGNIVFTNAGQDGARDIHTTGNNGGMRFYNSDTLTANPTGAAIQFFGNGSSGFPGQAFVDSGAHDNAAVIFRTAPAGGAITERMRIDAQGRVKAGTVGSSHCTSVGDICAGDDLVADSRVFAGTVSANCIAVGDICAGEDLVADDDVDAGGQVRAGTVTSASCADAGDICAGDDLVADEQVRAGTVGNANCAGTGDICAGADLVADQNLYLGGQVRAGTVGSSQCNSNGDVCAGDDLVADNDVLAGGNGVVKAAVFATCGSAGSAITRSFNNVNSAAITISDGASSGRCTIDFGFDVTSRYVVASAQNDGAAALGVTVRSLAENTVEFFRWSVTGDGVGGSIFVSVY